jgi:hypothetical protein
VRRSGSTAAAGGTSRKGGAPPGGERELYGEGNWKAAEEYREGLQEFSKTSDSQKVARKTGENLRPDLPGSGTRDVAESGRRGSEEEPEW